MTERRRFVQSAAFWTEALKSFSENRPWRHAALLWREIAQIYPEPDVDGQSAEPARSHPFPA